jgi:hypothetical protein
MNLFTFNPGDLIVSSQINANFQEFVRILGPTSTAAELALPGRLVLGSSNRASFSVLTDKITTDKKYLHVGWNAEESINGSSISLQRRLEQSASTVLRVGTQGFEVLYAKASEDIGSISPVFAVNESSAFLDSEWSFTNSSVNPQSISEYRLMLSPLGSPVKVHEAGIVAATAPSRNIDLSKFAQSFGSSSFHGVEITVTATAATGAGTEVSVYGQGLNRYTGLVLNLGSSQKDSIRGCVVFRRGANANQTLTISNSGGLSSLLINVVGLWK